VGLTKVRCYRPFPVEALKEALGDADVVAVVEKDVSIGYESALLTDIKAAFYNSKIDIPIVGFAAGLGGRDIPTANIRKIVERASEVRDRGIDAEFEFIDLKRENI
jgi:pyruvate ferredoxin oxidoreductase alpha subunit